MKNSFVNILFDLDGTLLDTTEGIIESVCHTLRVLNLPIPTSSGLLAFVGPPLQMSFMEKYGFDQHEAQNAADIFRDYYKTQAMLKAKLYPGIIQLMEDLKNTGKHLAVATYKREDYAQKILSHFGIDKYCESIRGADNFNQLKKSDIIKLCVEELGGDKKQSVLVGDTKHDALGAQEAGIDFLGVTYGFGFQTADDVNLYPNVGCARLPGEIGERLGF